MRAVHRFFCILRNYHRFEMPETLECFQGICWWWILRRKVCCGVEHWWLSLGCINIGRPQLQINADLH